VLGRLYEFRFILGWSTRDVLHKEQVIGLQVPGTCQQYIVSPTKYTTEISPQVDDFSASPIVCKGSIIYRSVSRTIARFQLDPKHRLSKTSQLAFGLDVLEEIKSLSAPNLNTICLGRLGIACIRSDNRHILMTLEGERYHTKSNSANYPHTLCLSKLN
jgi:hypothetical protein